MWRLGVLWGETMTNGSCFESCGWLGGLTARCVSALGQSLVCSVSKSPLSFVFFGDN